MPPEALGHAGAAALPPRGGYARQEVELAALRSSPQPLELSLALPFGALFSALLPASSFRVRELQLEYVDADRLGPSATYSAQVGGAHDGALELRLLVARGAWLCVRGRALLEIVQPSTVQPANVQSANVQPANVQKGGETHG
jgi:hypothetical protein